MSVDSRIRSAQHAALAGDLAALADARPAYGALIEGHEASREACDVGGCRDLKVALNLNHGNVSRSHSCPDRQGRCGIWHAAAFIGTFETGGGVPYALFGCACDRCGATFEAAISLRDGWPLVPGEDL